MTSKRKKHANDAGCGAESPDGYFCTELAFHEDKHQATDDEGKVYSKWKQGTDDFGLSHLIVLAGACEDTNVEDLLYANVDDD